MGQWGMQWTRKKENWLFLFAAVGALAALTRILEYVNINPFKPAAQAPSGVPVIPTSPTVITSDLWWAIGFVVFSIALSLAGLYFSNRRSSELVANLEAARAEAATATEFKEQVSRLTQERDDLHAEVARLNQHRIDLLGTLVQAKEAKQAKQDIAPLATPTSPPRITYLGANILQSQREDMPFGNQVRITFRNDCGHAISVSRPTWNLGPRGVVGYILGHQIHLRTCINEIQSIRALKYCTLIRRRSLRCGWAWSVITAPPT
jgi:hypothetical protein